MRSLKRLLWCIIATMMLMPAYGLLASAAPYHVQLSFDRPVYVDLDGDGITEKVELKRASMNQGYLLFNDSRGAGWNGFVSLDIAVYISDLNTKDKTKEIVVKYRSKLDHGTQGLKVYHYQKYGAKPFEFWGALNASSDDNDWDTSVFERNSMMGWGYTKPNGNGTIDVMTPVGIYASGQCFYANLRYKVDSKKGFVLQANKKFACSSAYTMTAKQTIYAYKNANVKKSNKLRFKIKAGEKYKAYQCIIGKKYTYVLVKKNGTGKSGWMILKTKLLDLYGDTNQLS